MANEIAPHNPGEVLVMAPEHIEVANTYLELQDIAKTAFRLGVDQHKVSEILSKKHVKAYIDNVFMEVGFNNRFKMRSLMDTVIEKKLQEMEEADIGSSKDITEILALSHKMAMDILDRQIKLATIEGKNQVIKSQTNVQINEAPGGTNYESLLNKLRDSKWKNT